MNEWIYIVYSKYNKGQLNLLPVVQACCDPKCGAGRKTQEILENNIW